LIGATDLRTAPAIQARSAVEEGQAEGVEQGALAGASVAGDGE
jgi:hypothetical protein